MFRRLREKYPEAEIHALLFEKNREILDLMRVIPPENIMTLSDRSLGDLAERQPGCPSQDATVTV